MTNDKKTGRSKPMEINEAMALREIIEQRLTGPFVDAVDGRERLEQIIAEKKVKLLSK